MTRRAPAVVPVVLALALAGCTGTPTGVTTSPATTAPPVTSTGSGGSVPPPGPDGRGLILDFNGSSPLTVTGSTADAEAQSVNGGEVVLGTSFDGTPALRLPEVSDLAEPPGLAVVLRGVQGSLPSPGTADISWGADVNLDPVTTTDLDNGDNVMQRGLASDTTQLKLQVDAGRPGCVLAGTGGRFMAKAKEKLAAGTWYRLRCDRHGDDLVLTVARLDGSQAPETITAQAPADEVQFDDAIPVSIGRKVSPDGGPVETEPDQLNGSLDNVWLSLP